MGGQGGEKGEGRTDVDIVLCVRGGVEKSEEKKTESAAFERT
jgi:hypothetical protein